MLSINTNLSSLIAQSSMKQSTNKLNLAIERMSTGFKINHASDNAANYSIATNMTTKINSYMVAEDNAAMGLDLISTAEGTLSQIQDKLSRLRALAEQSANGTYGEQSKQAINAEANALVDEIYRLYSSLEYNGINLSEPLSIEDQGIGADMSVLPIIESTIATYSLRATPEPTFINEVTHRDTSKMTTFASVDANTKITSGTYSISTDEELAKLATMANNGLIHGGEFVMANDIDLGDYSTGAGWAPIGVNHWSDKHFEGIFDGNGYAISGLFINKPSNGNAGVGLFGAASGKIKNLALVDVDITGQNYVAGIVGCLFNDITVDNCSVTGSIKAVKRVGAIAGNEYSSDTSTTKTISNCYTNIVITATSHAGGILGVSNSTNVINCLAEGNVKTNTGGCGGITGHQYHGNISNCASYVNLTDNNIEEGGIGGIAGVLGAGSTIQNCFATGVLTGNKNIGGIVGYTYSENGIQAGTIKNSTFDGTIEGISSAGGILGSVEEGIGGATIEGSTVTGTINGSTNIGGILGLDNIGNITIDNCYVHGESANLTSIFVGSGKASSTVSNCYSSNYYKTLGINDAGGAVVVGSVYTYNPTPQPLVIGLQVGVNSDSSSQINLEASVGLTGFRGLRNIGITNKDYTDTIDKILADVSAKQTHFGATSNRLESVLDEIAIQYDNLVSSRSTIRDADIAEVSASYIQQQILQQAAATLMSTANQSPAIALQLI